MNRASTMDGGWDSRRWGWEACLPGFGKTGDVRYGEAQWTGARPAVRSMVLRDITIKGSGDGR
jgi:hypothetical protein